MSMQPGGFLPPLDPNQQGPDNKRLFLTVILTTGLFMGMQFFLQKPQPEQAAATAGVDAGVADAVPSELNAAPAPAAGSTPDSLPEEVVAFSANVAEKSGLDHIVVKGGYDAKVSSHGAQITSFALPAYKDVRFTMGKTKEHPPVDFAWARHEGAAMVAMRSRGGDVTLAVNAPYAIVQRDEKSVTFERVTAAGVRITRSYVFDPARFSFTHEVTLKNESSAKKEAAFDVVFADGGGHQEVVFVGKGAMFAPTSAAAACRVDDSREAIAPSDIKDEKAVEHKGSVSYAAIDHHYFLAGMTFDGTPTQACKAVRTGDNKDEDAPPIFDLVVEQSAVTLAPGEVKSFRHEAFFGPKQIGLLAEFGHNFEENVAFGIFGAISRPMLWLLVQLYKYLSSFGLAIIALTFIVKLLTFPLTQKGYVGMQQMKKLQPELKALQEKYGHDKAVFGQKQMELFQKGGVNPLAGCFPMLIQMPVWFALYSMLSQAVELYQQPWGSLISDLTQPDALLFGFPFLPLIVGALMLVQTVMQPPPQDQPQMKYIMWGMPIFFTFLMINMASGLSIYMITNSLLTMAQQFYIKRKYA